MPHISLAYYPSKLIFFSVLAFIILSWIKIYRTFKLDYSDLYGKKCKINFKNSISTSPHPAIPSEPVYSPVFNISKNASRPLPSSASAPKSANFLLSYKPIIW